MINFLISNIQAIKKYISEPKCQIGIANRRHSFFQNNIDDLKIVWVENPSDGWYADPFILSQEENLITLLVEHFSYLYQKGTIRKLIVNVNNGKVKSEITILETKYHLSFPNIINVFGTTYVYPECNKSGCLYLYKYDSIRDELIEPVMLINHPIIDPVICKKNNKFYLFATLASEYSENSDSSVYVYASDNVFGPYKEYQVIKMNDPVGRSAGNIFYSDGMLIRPSQNCKDGYGLQVIFHKLEFINGRFSHVELSRLSPKRFSCLTGIHTFNFNEKYIVIDSISYRHGFLSFIIMRFYYYLKKYL